MESWLVMEERLVGSFEIVAEYGLKFMALPAAALSLALLFQKLRKEVPFIRTNEVQQLEAARLLRSDGTTNGPGSLHPYEKGLAYRILAKSRSVSIPEMELLLQLPDPYQHIERLASVRSLFDPVKSPSAGFSFAGRYRSKARREAAMRLFRGAGYLLGFLALVPVLALAAYHLRYVPQIVAPEQFSGIAAELLKPGVVWFVVFGHLAFECGLWRRRMHRAESLFEAVRNFVGNQKAGNP